MSERVSVSHIASVSVWQFLLHILDIRDAMDAERFVQVHVDPAAERKLTISAASKEADAATGE